MDTMKPGRRRWVLATMVLALFLAACGSDDVDAEAGGGQLGTLEEECPADVEDLENRVLNEETGECECEGEMFENPATGECTQDPDADEDRAATGDETADAAPEDDATACPEGQDWDPVNEECIAVDDPCTEFEKWDDDEETCVPTEECGPGTISGQTCRPDGGLLPGAEVTVEGVDCDGYPFTATTTADDQGFYTLEDVPAGEHELTITSGSFERTDEVIVNTGAETDLESQGAKICLEGTEVDIAVIGGTWDDIGDLLDGMGIEDYDFIGSSSSAIGSFLGDLSEMRQYDIIFAECGASWGSFGFDTDQETVENNLRRFVEEGNSLYASDLSDDYIDDTLPEAVEFASESGSGSQTVTADVVSSEMQSLLGSTTTEIYFNLGGWSIAEDGGPLSTVHFESDVDTGTSTLEDAALMITYDDPIGDGRAIYTSFHNTAQTTGDMEDILEFMIFQL